MAATTTFAGAVSAQDPDEFVEEEMKEEYITDLFSPPLLSGADEPVDLVTGYFDDDDDLDVATANGEEGTISILLGEGDGWLDYDGSFEDEEDVPEEDDLFIGAIDSGDLNGDGWDDIVATDSEDGEIWVLINEATGWADFDGPYTFGDEGDGYLGRPLDIVVGNFNDDEHLDVAVGLESVEDGCGSSSTTIPTPTTTPSSSPGPSAGDIDPQCVPSGVAVLFGSGDGGFAGEPWFSPTDSEPYGLLAADVNDDGVDDLLTADPFSETVSVYEADESDVFEAPSTVSFPFGASPRHLDAGDLDDDGDLDLVVVAGDFDWDGDFDDSDDYEDYDGSGGIYVLHGDGFGGFSRRSVYWSYEPFTEVVVEDLDLDGNLDVAASAPLSESINMLYGDGDGYFDDGNFRPIGMTWPQWWNYAPLGLAVGDFDDDGTPDLVAPVEDVDSVSVMLNSLDLPALTPEFGAPVATADGFTVQILNYDDDFEWTWDVTGGAVVDVDEDGLVTVTNVGPGASVTLTVGTYDDDHYPGSADLTGSALVPAKPSIPRFGTANPFTVIDDVPVKVPVFGNPGAPLVSIAATGTGLGSWSTTAAGDVYVAGDAQPYGSLSGMALNAPIVAITPTLTGEGYYLVAADGGVFAFGDAVHHGSMADLPLNFPITSLAPTCGGDGYYLVASDGGVFAYGDATFLGSMGGTKLNKNMLGLLPNCSGLGYWTFAADGGVFSFGNAPFHGSLGSTPPATGVVGMVPSEDGTGYWLIEGGGAAHRFLPA